MASEQISLFDDKFGRTEPEALSLTLASRRGRALTKAQRTFNRLVGEVEALRSKIERESRRLDEALAYYAKHLHPRLRRRAELRKEYVRGQRSTRLSPPSSKSFTLRRAHWLMPTCGGCSSACMGGESATLKRRRWRRRAKR